MLSKIVHILSVGLDKSFLNLDKPGFCNFKTNSGMGAMLLLRECQPDLMIVHWDLPDMPGEMLLRRIITTKPMMPTIAMVQTGNIAHEIAARSTGVTAVIDESIDEKLFCEMILQLCQPCASRVG